MANNNLKNFENALKSVDMGNLKVTYITGKNPLQVTRMYVWEGEKKIIDKSVSAVTKQENFKAMFEDIKNGCFSADLSTTQYNLSKGDYEGSLDDENEAIFDEDWHKSAIKIFKAIMLEEIKAGGDVKEVIEKYLQFHFLNDFTLCEQWLSLKKYHKVIKLSNGLYYTDDQLKMIHEVLQEVK